MSIRSRLALSYGAGVILTLVIVGTFVWWQMGAALRGSLSDTLQIRALGVVTSLENAGQAGLQEVNQAAPGVFVAMFNPAGSLVDASADAPNGVQAVNGEVALDGHHYLLRTQPAADGTLVVTGADLRSVDASQAALAQLLIGVGLSVGTASLLGGWLLAGRALRPVDRLIHDATGLGPANLDKRLSPPVRMDEVGRLTVTLNGMLDRIAESVERQRLFVAMAAHELRTPLASLRVELDVADRDDAGRDELRRAVRGAQGDAVRLGSLASSLLELATVQDDAARIDRRPVRLRELALAVVRDQMPVARVQGATISFEVPDSVVKLDRTRIEHAMNNLVNNALVHGGRVNPVEIRCRVDGEAAAGTLTVEVFDRGPGIGTGPPAGLFDPFVRGTHAFGPGSGLGLATVASAIRAHGGEFGAADREGGGARFWFTIPAEAVATPAASADDRRQLPDG